MKKILVLLFLFSAITYSQLYQGPASGSVPNGVIVNTNDFDNRMIGEKLSPYVKKPRNEEEVEPYPDYMNTTKPFAPFGSNVINYTPEGETDANPLILKNYQGFLDPGNYIPPDQYLAAGPQHIMGTDNGRFRIWDKNGNLLKNISADGWFSTALGGANAFDPKVSYDQFNKRWIMVWLDQVDSPPRGYYLVSVSDDSIPLGVWYNWAIRSSLYGSTESGTWSDYQGVGFDSQALYITGRQFGFTSGYFGNKVRIIPKTNLYANTAGQLTWFDMWDIRDPVNTSIGPDNIRPTLIYGSASEYYLFAGTPFTNGSYVTLYRIINPVTSPSMTGLQIPVTQYNSAPNAQQLGGGLSVEAGGSAFRFEPTVRGGFLWAVHPVLSPTSESNVSYLKINLSTNSAVEDYSYGSSGYYHLYPAIAVDQNQNILINFSRCSVNEYIGAFFTSRLSSDPPNTLGGTFPLKLGKANYSKDFSSGRNRWGDYSSAWLDPNEQNAFWTITEYAETPANTWACQVSKIRLVAYSTATVFASVDSLNFGTREVGTTSDTLSFKVSNYGTPTLTITGIQKFTSHYTITNSFSFPINLAYLDSIFVKVVFNPQTIGSLPDSVRITSNDPVTPNKYVPLKGTGFTIPPAGGTVIYGVTGTVELGSLLSINPTTGNATTIGPSGYTQLTGVTIRPLNGQLFGSNSGGTTTPLVRINSATGTAFLQTTMKLASVRGIAFDLNDEMYAAKSTDGRLYKVNITTGDTIFVGSTGISSLFGLTINPRTRQLWGIAFTGEVYRINKTNGTPTLVGSTGFTTTSDICFNQTGTLYGVWGTGATVSTLYTIDTNSGAGTAIGLTTKKGINGIAILPQPIGIEPISNIIPEKFELYQNYPNPFNPKTIINYDLRITSDVKLKVYDLLGREVMTLVNQRLQAGKYEASFDGINLSSGIYFYRIETDPETSSGRGFTETKKMVLIK